MEAAYNTLVVEEDNIAVAVKFEVVEIEAGLADIVEDNTESKMGEACIATFFYTIYY